jgi:molybdate transport system substrate-binding protein
MFHFLNRLLSHAPANRANQWRAPALKLRSPTLRSIALLPLLAAAFLATPGTCSAQLKVVISGGFSSAYRQLLPEFERETGVNVATASGASQGSGSQTIAAMLARGEPADVVVLSREGLAELVAAGRIVAGSEVDLARVPLGMGVRAGTKKPDISTIDTFKRALLEAKTLVVPASTAGIYVTARLLPQLGIADRVTVKIAERGSQAAAMVATGDADLVIQPVSEIVNATGIEFAGRLPDSIQLVQTFVAAMVTGTKEEKNAGRLIAFLASPRAATAIRDSGMETAAHPASN